MCYRSAAHFAEEYHQNISNGGLFVESTARYELRQRLNVELVLAHCGERIELPAEVVSVIPAELVAQGAAAGVALQFVEAAPVVRERLAPFLGETAKATHAEDSSTAEALDEAGEIRGPIEALGLMNLLQMFGTCSRCGSLEASRGDETGLIVFEDKSLRLAQLGRVNGIKALSRILAWKEGAFRFVPKLKDVDLEDPGIPLDGAIFEAVRLIDEMERYDPRDFPESAYLTINDESVSAGEKEVNQEEQAILDLVRAGFPLCELIDVIPAADADVYAALQGLMERGLVRFV